MGVIGFPETSVTTNLRCVTSQESEGLVFYIIDFALIFPTQDSFLLLKQFVNISIILLHYFVMYITLLG
jgi:hypothetical protein